MHTRIAGASTRSALSALAAVATLTLALAGCGTSQTSSSTSASSSASTLARSASTPTHSASTPTHSASTPSHSAGAARAAASCRPAQLALSYARTEGATGHMELTVAVRNTSKTACELRGYPGARLIGGGGRPLPLHVMRGHGFFPDTKPAPRRVALPPGASAHLGISFVTNNEFKGARICRTARAAMVSTPGSGTHWQRVSLRAAPRVSPCGNQMVVSPVHE